MASSRSRKEGRRREIRRKSLGVVDATAVRRVGCCVKQAAMAALAYLALGRSSLGSPLLGPSPLSLSPRPSAGSQLSSRFSGLTDEPVARSFSPFDGSVASTLSRPSYAGSVAGARGKLGLLLVDRGTIGSRGRRRFLFARSLLVVDRSTGSRVTVSSEKRFEGEAGIANEGTRRS